ncbi:hypothetical protein OG921_04560 [Aldersonia sp. NBC_00410]|uniref:hypothetical protein n=1 Tax=Aldersonia sp. NBC_00410 TaxID=2975954 RepID=UPI0022563639|nr:hypothetical protein [Aldersonia sp. NBC_00410]MCX5042446.1 hypothetical protein [Aldersonia sp. NBC_00410]
MLSAELMKCLHNFRQPAPEVENQVILNHFGQQSIEAFERNDKLAGMCSSAVTSRSESDSRSSTDPKLLDLTFSRDKAGELELAACPVS